MCGKEGGEEGRDRCGGGTGENDADIDKSDEGNDEQEGWEGLSWKVEDEITVVSAH